ncbi:hypothetical protein AMK59_7960, partial [Oryctes borbonicus]
MKEHITCNIDGCNFTAHEKIVATHIKTQHSTGLYYKICNISTPEDIRRWRDERKHNYPTKENIERKREQLQEMTERGERLVKNKQRNKDKQKLRCVRKTNIVSNIKRRRAYTKRTSLINEQGDWNGTMFPFKGTDDVYKTSKMPDNVTFEDSEWEQEGSTKPKININNALGALISAYSLHSDDSDCEKSVLMESKLETKQKQICDKLNSDDESPSQQPISRTPIFNVQECKNRSSLKETPALEEKSLEGGKKQKRKRVHTNKIKRIKAEQEVIHKTKIPTNIYVKRRVTLLENLLQNEIRHE